MGYFLLLLLTLFITGCASIPESDIAIDDPELKCLAMAIHGEARGEPYSGKVFVGRVVMTRLHLKYAPSICGVVHAPAQFAPRRDYSRDSVNAAKEARRKGGNGVTHFHSYSQRRTPSASFSVAKNCQYKTKVGGHWGYACQETRRPASR